MSDRIVFIPESKPSSRPKRVEDKPLRPAPVSVNDDRESKWVSQKDKKNSQEITQELKKAGRRIVMLAILTGSVGILFALVSSVLAFYGISLW